MHTTPTRESRAYCESHTRAVRQRAGRAAVAVVVWLALSRGLRVQVKTAMNEINAQKRLRSAANEKAEAEKIIHVKAAEADAESKYLSGVGVARQRQAIVNGEFVRLGKRDTSTPQHLTPRPLHKGLRDSIVDFSDGVEGTRPKDVMDLLLLTQYFDMIKEVGSHGASCVRH